MCKCDMAIAEEPRPSFKGKERFSWDHMKNGRYWVDEFVD